MSTMAINQGIYDSYSHISSGLRINSAADDAAGLGIGQLMQREETGLRVGAENSQSGIGALNVADGALDGVMDYLQRIRELALRSMNGLNSDDERQMYQNEINQLKDGIQSLAKDTSLNEMKLLDGSMADMGIVTNPNGGGMKIQMANSTLEALGIADFDVTSGNFSLDAIDQAMKMVSSQRSSMGAATNALEHTYNYNMGASLEQLSSRSKIEDLDFPKAISEKKKNEVLNEYKNLMLRQQMNHKSMITNMFF